MPQSIRSQVPGIPWRKVVGRRNRLMHVYRGTDDSVAWSIATVDVPAPGSVLKTLLQALPPAPSP